MREATVHLGIRGLNGDVSMNECKKVLFHVLVECV